MFRSKLVLVLGAIAVLGLAGEAFAQPGGGGGRRNRGGGAFDANVMRQQAAQRMIDALGCTPEEYTSVIQPKYEKVQALDRDLRGGGFGGGRMGGRGGAAGGAAAGAPAQSEVQQKLAALQALLQNQASNVEDVKAALKALRDARAKVREERKTALKALRDVLTPRQESIMEAQFNIEFEGV